MSRPASRSSRRARSRGQVPGRSAAPPPPPGPPPLTTRRWFRLGVPAVAAVAMVGAVIIGGNVLRKGDTTIQAPPPNITSPQARVRGEANAPVTIIEYADYQCHNCAEFTRTSEPELEKQYVQTGKVKLEVRQFPILGEASVRAAQASECAADQGKFWQYRANLYGAVLSAHDSTFNENNLKNIANRSGANGDTLVACLRAGHAKGRVDADLAQGKSDGVDSTPTFFINGKKLVGNQPWPALQQAIEQALTEPAR